MDPSRQNGTTGVLLVRRRALTGRFDGAIGIFRSQWQNPTG